MDNTWWIEFSGMKILMDPWLFGAEIDYFPWFNKQWHRTKPVSIEKLPEFDLCLITQKYPDHFHKDTLKKIRPKDIIGPKSIQKSIRKLLPDSNFQAFNQDFQNILGSNINLHFLPTSRKIDPIYDALILENGEESVFIATHGFSLNSEQKTFLNGLPKVKLAFTPFNRYKLPVFLGGEVSPGMESVQKLMNDLDFEKVVATHDEDKHAKGLVSKFAKIKWAPKEEEIRKEYGLNDRFLHIDHYNIVEV